MSISRVFWLFLFAVLGISSIIRRDYNYWLFILLISLGMLTVITIGNRLKGDLKEEWKSIEEKSAEWDRLIESEEKRKSFEDEKRSFTQQADLKEKGLQEKLGSLEKEKKFFEIQIADLQKKLDKLEYEKSSFETQQDDLVEEWNSLRKARKLLETEKMQLEKSPLKKLSNYHIFLDEIKELRQIEQIDRDNLISTDTIVDKIFIEIENTYYPKAFSEYSKNNLTEYIKIRNLYSENIYKDCKKRRNQQWAIRRCYDIDEAYKNK